MLKKQQMEDEKTRQALDEELAELNREPAERKERERTLIEAGKVRGYILILAFAAVILTAVIKNTVGAMIALIFFWKKFHR